MSKAFFLHASEPSGIPYERGYPTGFPPLKEFSLEFSPFLKRKSSGVSSLRDVPLGTYSVPRESLHILGIFPPCLGSHPSPSVWVPFQRSLLWIFERVALGFLGTSRKSTRNVLGRFLLRI